MSSLYGPGVSAWSSTLTKLPGLDCRHLPHAKQLLLRCRLNEIKGFSVLRRCVRALSPKVISRGYELRLQLASAASDLFEIKHLRGSASAASAASCAASVLFLRARSEWQRGDAQTASAFTRHVVKNEVPAGDPTAHRVFDLVSLELGPASNDRRQVPIGRLIC